MNTLAAVWHHMPDFPNAEATSKGQESSARRSIENAARRRGEHFDPARIRPMTTDELARTPAKPSPGVELRGMIYATETQGTLL